jgi:RNA polymerase sigma-70 factor (ECF subfamily)
MQEAAFEEAVRSLKDRVHAYAALMLRDAEEARDVTQEALVRLWENWGRVDCDGRRLWLLRTAHNLCIDRLRKRKVRREVDDETLLPGQPDPGPGPGRLAWAGELGSALERCLGSLTEVDRAVVVLREVQGMTYEEIATTLGLPMGTLKARLHRARERLRVRLTRAGVAP